jgi:hypothetical protein
MPRHHSASHRGCLNADPASLALLCDSRGHQLHRPTGPEPSLHRLGTPVEHRQGITRGEAKPPPYVLNLSNPPPPPISFGCWPCHRLAQLLAHRLPCPIGPTTHQARTSPLPYPTFLRCQMDLKLAHKVQHSQFSPFPE